MNYKELISTRRSVREYKKGAIKASHISELTGYLEHAKRLIKDISLELQILDSDAGEKLSGKAGYNGFMIEAPNYMLLLSDKGPNYIKNAGYVGEELVLKANDLGIGTCWVTFDNSDLAKEALNVQSDKEIVALIAMGYPDEKTKAMNVPKVGENESKTGIYRAKKEVSERMSVEEIVYMNTWGNSATVDDLDQRALLDAFHYARLAPSTMNRQPWRFILDDHVVVLAVRDDELTDSYEENIDAGVVMLYFEAIVDTTLTDITWTLDKPQKDYKKPSEYVVVGYCTI